MTEQYFEWKFYSEIIPIIIALAMVLIIAISDGIKKIMKVIKNRKKVKK